MSSVVFNAFKKRFLNGEVPKEDTWTFVPVNNIFNETFVDPEEKTFELEQFRCLDDFWRHSPTGMDESYFGGIRFDYDWHKPLDTTGTNKPMFITSGVYDAEGNQLSASNWEDFQTTIFYQDVSGNSDIPSYLASGGFYYILKKDELRWFADRSNSGNNRIIGVLGDGIEGVIRGQIGKDEAYPFNGILDGNGHTLENATIVCDSEDNGVVGVLGTEGVVKNFKIINDNEFLQDDKNVSLLCQKRIDLNHIKKTGRDINAGMLVGRNYGQVINVDAHEIGTFKFSGFVPQVYSVTNKSDDYEDFSTIRAKYDNGENYYYLNSWCINSPGNCCPYVGYFAEGLFAQSARGRLVSGSKPAGIEYFPAFKSKYNPGLCDTTLQLENKCADIAFYVKATNSNVGHFTKDNNKKYLNDPFYCQDADTEWGTNAVFIVGYTAVDETGKKIKYFFEINGTAFDKRSGKGKRRYTFHAGHYNYKRYIGFTERTPGMSEDDLDITNSTPILWDSGLDSGKYAYLLKSRIMFDNGTANSDEDGDAEEVSDDDFEISESDIKVYTEDGVPAKIIAQDISVMEYAPRNKDVSSAVWKGLTWRAQIEKGLYVFTGSVQNMEPGSSDDQKIYSYYFAFYAQETDPIHKRLPIDDDNTDYVHLSQAIEMLNVQWPDNESNGNGWCTNLNDGYETHSSTTKADTTNTVRWCVFEGELSREEMEKKITTADAEITADSSKRYSSYGFVDISAKTSLKFSMQSDVALQILEDAKQSKPEMITYKFVSGGGPDHYSSYIIVDEDDVSDIQRYLKKRSPTWVNGVTYDGTHKYDILINSDGGIRSEGSITLSLLTLERFQYRPFIHASQTDDIRGNRGKYKGMKLVDDGSVFPGAMFGNVSASYWRNKFDNKNENKSAASALALKYFTDAAKPYIRNPNYYGLDVNGYWTSNCVRRDPEDYRFAGLTGSTSEAYISTLNFNWNIMRRMFDTENMYYDKMAKYDAINDPEPWRLDGCYFQDSDGDFHKVSVLDANDKDCACSDLPHAILNKPLKMNNMARAAYYISPIVGSNFGRIQNVVVSSERTNVGNFVGFVGSIAGKQERGLVQDCSVYAKDRFKYFEYLPSKPDYNTMDESAFSAAMAEYDDKCKNYNYYVRYKATPILPNAVSEAVTTLSDNPDDDWTDYEYYPKGSEAYIDETKVNNYVGNGKSDYSGLAAYYRSIGVTKYIQAATNTEEAVYFKTYQENPDYIYDKSFFDASAPIRAFTSAWYDDYDVTAKNVMDDVVTYQLRPIFVAGGMFGKVVPSHNPNNLDVSGLTMVSGTKMNNCNVHYILEDRMAESAISNLPDLQTHTKDIHDAFGSIAGMFELQTSEVGNVQNGMMNKVRLENINVSGEGNTQLSILPFGFFVYQPNELNSMVATKDSPRKKGASWAGEYTETTYAIDLPLKIDGYMSNTLNNDAFAPVQHSSAAFFNLNKNNVEGKGGTISGENVKPIFNGALSGCISPHNVNINTSALTYYNVSSLTIKHDGKDVARTLDGIFGSYTTFKPALPLTGKPDKNVFEELENIYPTRTYEVGHTELRDNRFTQYTNFAPINIDCLRNSEIFKKTQLPDIYFDYTYSSTSSFIDDWTFKQNVKFTSALDADKFNRGVKPNDMNIRLGYVFRDDLNHSGQGFWYNNNYLHLGDSVSPKTIRTILSQNEHLKTSGCAGYYYDDYGELVSADDKHKFAGMLVLDSQDRTVMYIDNTMGASIDDGCSYNLMCRNVCYDGTSGGMLLEVK